MAALTLLVVLVASFLLATNTGRRVDTATDTNSLQAPLEAIGDSPRALTSANQNQEQAVRSQAGPMAESGFAGPSWPDGVEGLIFDYFSQQEEFEFTSITSVQCEVQTCEIVFTGTNPNPLIVDDFSELVHGLYRPPLNARQGSIGTREIAAGAREYVIKISNVPYIEPTGRK